MTNLNVVLKVHEVSLGESRTIAEVKVVDSLKNRLNTSFIMIITMLTWWYDRPMAWGENLASWRRLKVEWSAQTTANNANSAIIKRVICVLFHIFPSFFTHRYGLSLSL